jgi:ubiquitin-like modifier-activating enzyme 5
MEAELKEMLNDLDSLKQSQPDPSNLASSILKVMELA